MSNLSAPILNPEVYADASLGELASSIGHGRIISLDPEGPTQQVDVLTITSPANSSAYVVTVACTVNGLRVSRTLSFTTDGSASAAELGAGLYAAYLADGQLTSLFSSVTDSGAGVLTFVWKRGFSGTFTLTTNPSTAIAKSTTAAAAGPSYGYGSLVQVVSSANMPSNNVSLAAQSPVAVAGAVLTFTVTHGAGATYTAVVQNDVWGGGSITKNVSASAGANAAATDAAIIAALEAAFTNATGAAPSTGTVTLTFPAGDDASAWDALGTGGGGSPALAVAKTSGPAALPQVAIVLNDHATAPLESRTALTSVSGSDPGQSVRAIMAGDGSTGVGVAAQHTSYTLGSAVWYDTSGLLYNAAAPGRIPAPGLRWVKLSSDSTIAILAL